jgi:hypothetical protein
MTTSLPIAHWRPVLSGGNGSRRAVAEFLREGVPTEIVSLLAYIAIGLLENVC